MFYVNDSDLEYVQNQTNEIVEKLRAEFGALNSSDENFYDLIPAKFKRISELLPCDFSTDSTDGLEVREEILWCVSKAILPPLDALLQFDFDVIAHASGSIFVYYLGMWQKVDLRFNDEAHFLREIERLLKPFGVRVDKTHPTVSVVLSDGSRVTVAVPPIAPDGATLTIQRSTANKLSNWTLEELAGEEPPLLADGIKFDRQRVVTPMLSPAMANVLAACMKGKVNIIVSGGKDAGKTTLLRALCEKLNLPNSGRNKPPIALIETTAELLIPRENVVRLSPMDSAGSEGRTQNDLLRIAMNMMADRIILGDCKGAEAFDFIRLMSSEVQGCVTTITANTARQCLTNLETMMLEARPGLPLQTLRHLIAQAYPLIVQVRQLEDGTRRVTEIVEVRGVNDGSWRSNRHIEQMNQHQLRPDDYILGNLFHIEREGRDPRGFFKIKFAASFNGAPAFLEQLEREAVPFKLGWLKPEIEKQASPR